MNFSYYFLDKWQVFFWRFDKIFIGNIFFVNIKERNKANFFFYPIDFVAKKDKEFHKGSLANNINNKFLIQILKNHKDNFICLYFFNDYNKNLFEENFEGIQNYHHVILYLQGIGNKIEYSKDKRLLLFKLDQSNTLKLPLKSLDYELTLLDNQTLLISGISKEKVHSIAAKIRSFKLSDPYKGKGIKYFMEYKYKLKKAQK
uniref:50S ribosomal protein L6 n=1 Tax=Cyanidiococcus yangmingshanensis TaxID=2690220 RepID=A0A7H0WBE9_9RHOD|nr:50S ribosomal protein L6 [Cyanidiococcus yangmingshanensis]UNJ18953.1 ribosomal protein L6 [Cyanidioschyzonaceae sp. 2 FvB-2021]